MGCYIFRDNLLQLVNTPQEAYAYTMDYTVICILGLIFIYGYNVVSAIMRGMGDSKRPFMFVAIAAIINIVLDIVFVAGFKMEVAGAAWATVIGQSFSFIFAFAYLYKRKEEFGFDFKLKSFIPDGNAMAKISALGIPMALQSASISISQTVVAAWVNSFGIIYSAIAGIISKLNMMMGIMSNSITTAAASMIGQNLGARKYDRVPKILAWAFGGAFTLSVIGSIVIKYDPDMIFGMFTSDEAVLAEATIIVLPAILNFFGAATRCFALVLLMVQETLN